MQAIITDPDTIERVIRSAIHKALSDQLPTLVRKATSKPWLTKKELKALTGWSDRTIQHLRDTRQVPFSQHGRKILYPREGIEAFLQEHHIKVQNR